MEQEPVAGGERPPAGQIRVRAPAAGRERHEEIDADSLESATHWDVRLWNRLS